MSACFKKKLLSFVVICSVAGSFSCLAKEQQVKKSAIKTLSNKKNVAVEDFGKQHLLHDLKKASLAGKFDHSILSKNTYDELKFKELLKKLDRTTTMFGKLGLKELSMPVSDGTVLKKRQLILKKFIQDPAFYKRIGVLLNNIKSTEPVIADYWNPDNKKHNQVKKLYYTVPFLHKYLNDFKVALDCTIAAPVSRLVRGLCCTVVNGGLCLFSLGKEYFSKDSYMNKAQKLLPQLITLLKDSLLFPLTFNFDWREESKAFTWSGRMCYDGLYKMTSVAVRKQDPLALEDDVNKIATSTAKWYTGIGIAGYDAYLAYWLTGLYKKSKDHFHIAKGLQSSLVNLSVFFRSLTSLQKLAAAGDKKSAQKNVPLEGITQLLSSIQQKKGNCARLIELMHTPTFDAKSSWWHSRGNVLHTHRLMQKAKKQLIPLFQKIGELDAFHSLATLYKQRDGKSGRWSFVDFVQKPKPILTIKNGWTPLLSADKAVTNDIALGDKNAQNILLSGPNATGKSVTMFMMAHIIALAQSWGIAPAKNVTMTLFNKLITALDPKADVNKQASSFLAQKRIFDTALKHIMLSKKANRVATFSDEPLHGTFYKRAGKDIKCHGKKAAQYDQSCSIIATHLEQPTDLEKETNGAWVNHQMDVEEDKPTGKFINKYKIKKGFPAWWFEDEKPNEDEKTKRDRFFDSLQKKESENSNKDAAE